MEQNLKIAVPTRDSVVDDHFGHCSYYTIYGVENGKVVSKESYPSPQGCGCKSGVAPILAGMGVKVMLAGNMGQGAKNVLESNNIEVFRGCSGDTDALVESYLAGNVKDSGEGCHSHECH